MLVNNGLDQGRARFYTFLDVETAKGMEESMNDVVEKITGRPPLTFDDFAQKNKVTWL